MKITGTSSYIILDDGGRKIKATGEMLSGGFIAILESMKFFEPPHEKEELTEEIKKEYRDKAIKKTKGTSMEIKFE
ncbi:hypothetical protein FJU30_17385 [Affinibrenneria salicis]|uniref:Uncharacterized protein n=1 Tax=Affinibrenneria salicis TaxID=2590031 RepID=A0A5J5FWY0_9GAMM|nr:Imm74 family immunity protein [Affinibrenneria salicis]KAA8998186.1 hypothetical protein FJU30_17385 [Affinibrenneria salicis]